MPSTPDSMSDSPAATEQAARLPYETPELVDQGDLTELTKGTGINVPSADLAYS